MRLRSTAAAGLVLLSAIAGVALVGALRGDDAPSGAPTPVPSESSPRGQTTSSDCSNERSVAGNRAAYRPGGASGDIDGDGARDRVVVATDEDGARGCRAFLIVQTRSGVFSAAVEEGFDATLGLPRLGEVPPVPIDPRTGNEIVVTVASGASTQFAAVYSMGSGSLQRMTVPEPAPGAFAYGGSVGHIDAVDCGGAPGSVVASTAVPAAEPNMYEVTRHTYAAQEDEFVLDEALTETETAPADDLDRFPEFASPSPFFSC